MDEKYFKLTPETKSGSIIQYYDTDNPWADWSNSKVLPKMVSHENQNEINSDKAHDIVKLLQGFSISQAKAILLNVEEILTTHLPITLLFDASVVSQKQPQPQSEQ